MGGHDDDKSVGALVLRAAPCNPLPSSNGGVHCACRAAHGRFARLARLVRGLRDDSARRLVGVGGQAIAAPWRTIRLRGMTNSGAMLVPKSKGISGWPCRRPNKRRPRNSLQSGGSTMGDPAEATTSSALLSSSTARSSLVSTRGVERGFEPFLADHAAEKPARAHECGRRSDRMWATIDQIVVQFLAGAHVLRRLPAEQAGPDGGQHPIDGPTAKGDHVSIILMRRARIGNRRRTELGRGVFCPPASRYWFNSGWVKARAPSAARPARPGSSAPGPRACAPRKASAE